VPDLTAPASPFRPGLSVKGAAHLGVFEMTWDNDGRAILQLRKRINLHPPPDREARRRSFSGKLTPIVGEANKSPGSQTGSQRRQAPGDTGRHLATISPASWRFRRCKATSSDRRVASYKRGVTGSNPVAPTRSPGRSRLGGRQGLTTAVGYAALGEHVDRQAEDRLLADALREDHGLVFASTVGTPLDHHNVRREFKRITQAARPRSPRGRSAVADLPDFGVDSPVPRPCSGGAANGICLVSSWPDIQLVHIGCKIFLENYC
jgi:hypothetical protein